MAIPSQLSSVPLSYYNHIDALLNSSPDWNYFQPKVANTLFYSFALPTDADSDVTGQAVFTPMQRFYAAHALDQLAMYTGIKFVETQNADDAQILLLNGDIKSGENVMGLASWRYGWDDLPGGGFANYEAWGTLFMDNNEYAAQNANLAPGTEGYEVLLHELGHLIGLKHPHQGIPENTAVLPTGQDGTSFTVMSYSSFNHPGQSFAMYDIAALRWLYGGDGLGGARGVGGSGGVYLTGTPFPDTLTGTAFSDMLDGSLGNDVINGGAGTDFAVFDVPRYLLTVTRTAEGLTVDDGSSIDQLIGVERILYTGGAIAFDIDGSGGQAYRIYNAVLDRTPDVVGLGFWLSRMDGGVALRDVAADFMTSAEFVANFGANLSNLQLVQTLYQNILNRPAEPEGINYWVGALDANKISQAEALAMISEGFENRASVDPTIANGFTYTPWG